MTEEPRTDRLRALLTRVVETIGGIPAVRTLFQVLEVYDGAGGGLVANGLAYAALFALIPGALLVAGAIGIFVTDPATQQMIVDLVAQTVPPLADVVETALESVAAGAVPFSIIALVGLLWGASRFYAALDYAFSRIFHEHGRRNEVVRTLRGVLLTFLFVALPLAALLAGSLLAWLIEVAPDARLLQVVTQLLYALATPIGSIVLAVVAVSLVYRFVPLQAPSVRAFGRPALLTGLALGLFTQLFTFIAPRMVGYAALFGAFVAVFAILIWLSISFNMLIFGASWTRVRAQVQAERGVADPVPAGKA
ncbi:MAG TPA: YihY/virulence factor BrkB family protein [Candidatus Limnocylindrales bacterium]|nr:YihY/virulence factor BrkB family protein [Candidatus Limnocylindrales bacterium]